MNSAPDAPCVVDRGQRQNSASRMMIGNGIPISHSRAPLPQVMVHLQKFPLVEGITAGLLKSSNELGCQTSTILRPLV